MPTLKLCWLFRMFAAVLLKESVTTPQNFKAFFLYIKQHTPQPAHQFCCLWASSDCNCTMSPCFLGFIRHQTIVQYCVKSKALIKKREGNTIQLMTQQMLIRLIMHLVTVNLFPSVWPHHLLPTGVFLFVIQTGKSDHWHRIHQSLLLSFLADTLLTQHTSCRCCGYG